MISTQCRSFPPWFTDACAMPTKPLSEPCSWRPTSRTRGRGGEMEPSSSRLVGVVRVLVGPVRRGTKWKRLAHIQFVAVTKMWRGLGVGSALLDRVDAVACRERCYEIKMEVDVVNAGARRLYERRGFAIHDDLDFGNKLSARQMRTLRSIREAVEMARRVNLEAMDAEAERQCMALLGDENATT
mmetsp:Transcript_45933/g.127470  ORF Transcript_45933/g.127470 Transcript_45933/m.127470 type:complete len:185 (-) Transcript_45933:182-736(-)